MWLFRTGDFGPAVLTINYLLFLSPVKLVQIHAYKVLGWDPHVSPPSSFNKRGVRCCPGDWRFKASRVTVTPLPCLVGEEGIEPSRSETVDLQSTEPTALLNSPEIWWNQRELHPHLRLAGAASSCWTMVPKTGPGGLPLTYDHRSMLRSFALAFGLAHDRLDSNQHLRRSGGPRETRTPASSVRGRRTPTIRWAP